MAGSMRAVVALGLLVAVCFPARGDDLCGPPLRYYAPWTCGPYLLPLAGPRPAPAAAPAATRPAPNFENINPLPKAPAKRAPAVSEARSQGGSYVAKKEPNQEICRVGFWNVTGRDVELIVDGQPRTLPRDRAITLELGRVFSWQMGAGQRQTVTVPDGRSVHEIVLRDPSQER